MKRFLSLALLSIILITIFTSCSGSGPQLLSFLDESSAKLDLLGKTITICSEADYDEYLFEQKANTIMYDAIVNRLDDIEEEFNCEFEHLSYPGPNGITLLQTLASTGDSHIDILYGHGYNRIGKLAYSGVLYPLTSLREYLDYENSEKFGSAGLLEAAMVNGVPYGVQPVQWFGFANSFAFHVAWNVDKFNQYGLPNLHEYYENGTWTWDTFENLFTLYKDVATQDVDLLALCKEHFALISLMANDVKFCDYNGSEYYCDFTDQKTYTAAEWVLNLFEEQEEYISFTDRWEVDDFISENALMIPVQNAAITLIIPYDAEFKFGVMPFPCGPDATYGEWANYVEAMRGFGISFFSDVPDASAIVLNKLMDPFPEVNPSGDLTDYYAEQVFYTRLDAEIFLEVGKYARNFYSVDNDVLWSVIEAFKSPTTAAEIITSYEARVQALVDDEIRPNFENYVHEKLYGGK